MHRRFVIVLTHFVVHHSGPCGYPTPLAAVKVASTTSPNDASSRVADYRDPLTFIRPFEISHVPGDFIKICGRHFDLRSDWRQCTSRAAEKGIMLKSDEPHVRRY